MGSSGRVVVTVDVCRGWRLLLLLLFLLNTLEPCFMFVAHNLLEILWQYCHAFQLRLMNCSQKIIAPYPTACFFQTTTTSKRMHFYLKIIPSCKINIGCIYSHVITAANRTFCEKKNAIFFAGKLSWGKKLKQSVSEIYLDYNLVIKRENYFMSLWPFLKWRGQVEIHNTS